MVKSWTLTHTFLWLCFFPNSMKWNGTEFLYHPQLLQVQIITKKLKRNLKTSKVATPKTRGKKGSLQGFKTHEVTKSWNDQRLTSVQFEMRTREAIQCPNIFREDNWSETRSLCLLNSFDKAHVPTLLLALLILATPPTHHRGVEWAAVC